MNLFKKIPFLFIILGLSVSYTPIIFKSQLVNPDAQVVILYLQQLSGIGQYFIDLWNLHTIDFQPIRDLSLFIDLVIYESFGLNLSIFFNLLIWFLSCLNINKIISKTSPILDSNKRLYFILLFSLYPLFSTTISWGVARKHLLSFLFTTYATDKILSAVTFKNYQYLKKASIYFILSILAQPINLLWAFWAVFYVKINWRERFNKSLFLFIPSFLIVTLLNWIYYNYSLVFKTFYNSKTEGIPDLIDKLLAIGHYTTQLIFPHNLTFLYTLGEFEQIIGIGICVVMIYLTFKLLKEKKSDLLWLVFTVSPVLIILNTPKLLIDAYLLTPSLGCFVILCLILEKFSPTISNKFLFLLIPLIPIFIVQNFNQSKIWGNKVQFTKHSFLVRPSCDSAKTAARIQYEEQAKLDADLKTYLEKFDCLRIPQGMTLSQVMIFIKLNTFIIYYAEELEFSKKISALESMSKRSPYPNLAIAALYAQKGDEQSVKSVMARLNESDVVFRQRKSYDRIVAKELFPFCHLKKIEQCLKVTKNMIYPSNDSWM